MELTYMIMGEKFTHIVRGKKRTTEENFACPDLESGKYAVWLPRLDRNIVDEIKDNLRKVRVPPLEKRKELIASLRGYSPSIEKLHLACKMSGHPVSLMKEMISDSKRMLKNIAEADSRDSEKTAYVGIPANDPRESFYFIAHSLLAGAPLVLKPSAQEPVISRDVVLYLQDRGMPDGFINLVYADTGEREESRLLLELMGAVDTPIIMGSTNVSERQISFKAEHSRGLVLDADKALPYLGTAVRFPHSCLTEHNYVVVGKDNFDKVVEGLYVAYSKLKPGDLLTETTNMSRVDEEVLKNIGAMLRIGEMNDSMRVLYPLRGREIINGDFIRKGAIVEHFREDKGVGMNPLMTVSLPVYVTGVRRVDSVEEALIDLEGARKELIGGCGAEKSMALGVYGDVDKGLLSKLSEYAHDISVNKSPFNVDGLVHQGIDLNKRLTE
jgi:hypothetical protein